VQVKKFQQIGGADIGGCVCGVRNYRQLLRVERARERDQCDRHKKQSCAPVLHAEVIVLEPRGLVIDNESNPEI
jgi:hypothetical protein